MKKWIDNTASEVMDSQGAFSLIGVAAGETLAVTGDDIKTLCIGCGDGTELGFFKDVVGIDLNNTSLEKCKAKGYHVEKMDMHELTFNDNSFDLVFARDSFEHAVAPIQVLSEMARVSKRYVSITLPDQSWDGSHYHYLIPTLRQMLAMADKVGLNLRSYREFNRGVGQMVIFQHLYIFEKRRDLL